MEYYTQVDEIVKVIGAVTVDETIKVIGAIHLIQNLQDRVHIHH
jgi:hypothetical protein